MSCVVGIAQRGKIYLCADSYGCQENSVQPREDPKIFSIKGKMIIGFAGQWRAGQVIQHDLQLPRKRPNLSDFDYIVRSIVPQIGRIFRAHRVYNDEEKKTPPDMSYLFGYNGCIYRVESDLNVSKPVNGYAAIGAGEEYALGSLYTSRYIRDPMRRMELAQRAAQYHCPWVGPPFVGFELGPDGIVPFQV